MRFLAAVLALLTALLLAPAATAQPPSTLSDHITDNTGALTGSSRNTVSSAIDRLQRDRKVQLWVVYVDNFSRFKPENWAEKTRTQSGMGDDDVLLAIATNTKAYVFSVPPTAQGISAAELNTLQTGKIAPAVAAKDWSGAAVAAADGLNTTDAPTTEPRSSNRLWLWVAIAVVAVLLLLLVVFLVIRRRRRRRSEAPPVEPAATPAIAEPGDGSPLSTADARVRQISDYIARHRDTVGKKAQAKFEEAQRNLAAAHDRQAGNEAEATAYANAASTLAAEAQTLANADVTKAHRPRRR